MAKTEFHDPEYADPGEGKKYFVPRKTLAVREVTMAQIEVFDGKVILTGIYGRTTATPELIEEHIANLQEAVDFIREQE